VAQVSPLAKKPCTNTMGLKSALQGFETVCATEKFNINPMNKKDMIVCFIKKSGYTGLLK
jgi:hypothetical protein